MLERLLNAQSRSNRSNIKSLVAKYDFSYPEEYLLELAKALKYVVDDKAKYTDWSQRADIKVELKVDHIMLLAKFITLL